MDRISINLLPPNLKDDKKLAVKKKLVNRISISILGCLILLTAILIGITISQNRTFDKKAQKVAAMENKINSLKENEAAAAILKKRLATVNQIKTKQYPQSDSFVLISSLLTPGINMQSFSTDKSNEVNIQGNANTAADMQKFFDNLSDPAANEGKVAKTVISNLSRGPTPRLIFDLSVTTNFGGKK